MKGKPFELRGKKQIQKEDIDKEKILRVWAGDDVEVCKILEVAGLAVDVDRY